MILLRQVHRFYISCLQGSLHLRWIIQILQSNKLFFSWCFKNKWTLNIAAIKIMTSRRDAMLLTILLGLIASKIEIPSVNLTAEGLIK